MSVTSSPVNESQAQVLTVEQLNRQIKQLLEGQVGIVWIKGEISNFKPHTSGHFYFSLKDASSQISAVMFRGSNSKLKFNLKDGLEVIARGRISVFEPRGSYQIICDLIEPVGAGALQKAFEQLKEKLKQEGLFDSSRKRPLPDHPKHIAVVTSPTGAAIRDILNILRRRNKTARVTVIPTLVQGEGASAKIVEAIHSAWKLGDVDVMIVGRGGGSIEDLWAFNDEQLARTIASSPMPVISAVGHEVDFTIADFVADLRAPTPSAAAELVVKNVADIESKLNNLNRILSLAQKRILKFYSDKLSLFAAKLVDPKQRLADLQLRNDDLLSRMQTAFSFRMQKKYSQVRLASSGLVSPQQIVERFRTKAANLHQKVSFLMKQKIERKESIIYRYMGLLDSLSPLKVLDRGYSIVKAVVKTESKTDFVATEQIVKDEVTVQPGDQLKIRNNQSEIIATVIEQKFIQNNN